jgi:hypothetical protein
VRWACLVLGGSAGLSRVVRRPVLFFRSMMCDMRGSFGRVYIPFALLLVSYFSCILQRCHSSQQDTFPPFHCATLYLDTKFPTSYTPLTSHAIIRPITVTSPHSPYTACTHHTRPIRRRARPTPMATCTPRPSDSTRSNPRAAGSERNVKMRLCDNPHCTASLCSASDDERASEEASKEASTYSLFARSLAHCFVYYSP